MANKNILLSQEGIAKHVARLAKHVVQDISDDWVVVALMDGAMIFATDLLRALYDLGVNPQFETLCLSSYGAAHQSSGRVRCLKDIDQDLSGRRVLIVDDIFESGHTLEFARRYMGAKGANHVKACVFARKDIGPIVGRLPEYIGWNTPDVFLIGYGLDDNKRFRGQPFISGINPL